MTERDAYMILQEVKDLDDSMYAYSKDYNEALEMALSALKKQVPMKPKVVLGNVRKCETPCLITCPTCGVLLEDGYRPRYIPSWKNGILHCDMCGQAIDWSEYEKHERTQN